MEFKHDTYSSELQDLAALRLLSGRENPTFLDIGCCAPIQNNNTYLLEKNGWEGVCVDIRGDFSEEFEKTRVTPFYEIDAKTKEFIKILKRHFPNKGIDYISLDADQSTLEILENLLYNDFNFNFMTFEHDYHYAVNEVSNGRRLGYGTRDEIELRKHKSKEILQKLGYHLLFEDVSFRDKHTGSVLHPWEDWWINPQQYSNTSYLRLDRMRSKNIHFKDCLDRIFEIVKIPE